MSRSQIDERLLERFDKAMSGGGIECLIDSLEKVVEEGHFDSVEELRKVVKDKILLYRLMEICQKEIKRKTAEA